ncbi:MAG: hypothetical protein QM765_15440 [Myxococcales bacterium]
MLTKPADGSVVQYDAISEEAEWTVQIRGEPTVLDLAADIDELAVANAEDNGVDIIQASSGLWLGRISFGLELGSADDGPGGVVAPYSYDPRLPARDYAMHALARAAGMVLVIDASSLELTRTVALAHRSPPLEPVSAPLRLAVTSDLHTVVVHERELGILDRDEERLVVEGLPDKPTTVVPLPGGGLLVGSVGAVEVFGPTGDDEHRGFALSKRLELADGVRLAGLGVRREAGVESQILVVRSSKEGYAVTSWSVADFGSAAPANHVALPLAFGDFLGVADLKSGPAVCFGKSADGPVIITWPNLFAEELKTEASWLDGPLLGAGTPDQQLATWLSERQGVFVTRLLLYDPEGYVLPAPGFGTWATYQIPGRGSGPGFDPSGQWMYVPVPKLDQISVFQ